ncbi:MAG: PorT family protein [Candidatus Cardinium sp.]|nr:PorT family protein [Candidatus Cardinium sp.]
MISIKKYVIAVLVLYGLNGPETAHALAGRFSIELSPALSINKIYNSNSNKIELKDRGIAPGLISGLAYHFPLQAHCSVSAGVSYALGHMGVIAFRSASEAYETYLLQSIWLPILCRLYTSEIKLDTSMYFKLGLIPSIGLPRRLISSKVKGTKLVSTRQFNGWVHLGGGIKYDFSLTNSLMVGISYYGDVSGIMHTKEAYGHNHFFCLDICLLF